jgi:hypothetical protein
LCSQTFAQSQAAEIDKFDLTKLFKPNTRRGDFLTTFLNTPSYKFLDKDYWSDFHISDIASAAQLTSAEAREHWIVMDDQAI